MVDTWRGVDERAVKAYYRCDAGSILEAYD